LLLCSSEGAGRCWGRASFLDLSFYADISTHQLMLADAVRTHAYERALAAVVRPHHRVLDFGCGTGILSFFAHRAGAARVYAVDRSRFIRGAQAVAQANGFSRIEFFHGEDVTLPTPVDVLVSEWMGHFVFNESMLEPLVGMRDRYLAPGGVMIPRKLSLHAGVITDPGFSTRYGYFSHRPYDIDFSPLVDASYARTEVRTLQREQVAPTVIPLGTLDMQTCTRTPELLTGSATFAAPTTAYGLAGWFDAELADGVGFGTGPYSPRTHWKPIAFPLPAPFVIEPGEPVHVEIEPVAVDDDRRHWCWTLRQGDREVEQDELGAASWAWKPLAPGRLP
jgi:protein arginine N-methyltransferase 1